jgi:hypothetical protein
MWRIVWNEPSVVVLTNAEEVVNWDRDFGPDSYPRVEGVRARRAVHRSQVHLQKMRIEDNLPLAEVRRQQTAAEF